MPNHPLSLYGHPVFWALFFLLDWLPFPIPISQNSAQMIPSRKLSRISRGDRFSLHLWRTPHPRSFTCTSGVTLKSQVPSALLLMRTSVYMSLDHLWFLMERGTKYVLKNPFWSRIKNNCFLPSTGTKARRKDGPAADRKQTLLCPQLGGWRELKEGNFTLTTSLHSNPSMWWHLADTLQAWSGYKWVLAILPGWHL